MKEDRSKILAEALDSEICGYTLDEIRYALLETCETYFLRAEYPHAATFVADINNLLEELYPDVEEEDVFSE